METLDISMPLDPKMLIYGDDPPFALTQEAHSDPKYPGDYYCFSRLEFITHTGTHIDPPRHLIPGGSCVDRIDLEILCGPAFVLDLEGKGKVISNQIFRERAKALKGVRRLLLRTDNCRLLGAGIFQKDYAHLTPEAALYLRQEIGIGLIGIDYLSVDPWPVPWPGFGFPAHHALLDGDDPVVILESIDLRKVAEGEYELLCLPLRIADGDGAPARALLRR